jgi:hypothetical protein
LEGAEIAAEFLANAGAIRMSEPATEATKIMRAMRIFEVSLSKRSELQERFVGDF